jgi:hypothetical protein
VRLYRCSEGHYWERGTVCPACGDRWVGISCRDTSQGKRLGRPGFYTYTFKPFTEDNFTGEPIEVHSREQRDRLCADHHVTYDRYSNLKPKLQEDSSDTLGDIGFKEWADRMQKDGQFEKRRSKRSASK